MSLCLIFHCSLTISVVMYFYKLEYINTALRAAFKSGNKDIAPPLNSGSETTAWLSWMYEHVADGFIKCLMQVYRRFNHLCCTHKPVRLLPWALWQTQHQSLQHPHCLPKPSVGNFNVTQKSKSLHNTGGPHFYLLGRGAESHLVRAVRADPWGQWSRGPFEYFSRMNMNPPLTANKLSKPSLPMGPN